MRMTVDGRRSNGRKVNALCETEDHLLELDVMMEVKSGLCGSQLLPVRTVSMRRFGGEVERRGLAVRVGEIGVVKKFVTDVGEREFTVFLGAHSMRCGYLHLCSSDSSLSICSEFGGNGLREESSLAWGERGSGAEAEVGAALKMLTRRSGCTDGNDGFGWVSKKADCFRRGEDGCKKPLLVVVEMAVEVAEVSVEMPRILSSWSAAFAIAAAVPVSLRLPPPSSSLMHFLDPSCRLCSAARFLPPSPLQSFKNFMVRRIDT